jgi:AcrR family transcriptional regulator
VSVLTKESRVRITQEARAETRERILAAAQRLFRTQGFEATTTRDIAAAAGIAAGTLFNYFPTKEAIVMTLATEALAGAWTQFARRRREGASLEEDLFGHVAAGLRKLRPYRACLPAVLETALSPLAAPADDRAADLRAGHLEAVDGLVRERKLAERFTPVAAQLYWTLYTGVLSFWSRDASPRQEDTLALLDQSLRMFVAWLTGPREGAPSAHAGKGS